MDISNYHKGCRPTPMKVSAERPSTYKLSEEQRQYFKENGFLVIKRLVDFTDLYNYKQHFIRICKGLEWSANMTVVKEKSLVGKVTKKEDYINKLNDVQHDDVFMTYTEHPLILDVVAQLIGGDIDVVNGMFINKPPGASIHPPHQDLHYLPYRPADKVIGTWTAIDEATFDNGCLWVVPGSHRPDALYPHKNETGSLKLYHSINDNSVAPPEKRMHLEMEQGDTIFFHSLLVHGSRANISKNHRKCLSAHYISADCEVIDVRGTEQEGIKRELEAELNRRGLCNIDFAEMWRLKAKEVRRKSML